MIKFNNKEVLITRFPDNSIKFDIEGEILEINILLWKFESMEELIVIIGLADKIKFKTSILIMPYIPNARMDKVTDENEGFMLKYFVETLDSLKFNEIKVLDPHSDVYKKWITKTKWVEASDVLLKTIKEVINVIEVETNKDIQLVMPDKGAKKRYENILNVKSSIYGYKERNQKTGEIINFDLVGDINENPILIIDDICSKGGTFYYTAKKLREKGFQGDIYLYVSHLENAVQYGELLKENSPIKKIFTTDSLITISHDKIVKKEIDLR